MHDFFRWFPGLALVVTLSAAFTGGTDTPSRQGQDDPLALFSKMMPVFMHPRCVNCHGATDPQIPRKHPQQVGPDEDCTICHTTEPDWTQESAGQFVGQTAAQLCELMAFSVVDKTPAGFLHHIDTDRLILQSWTGLKGGARETPDPTPTMSHQDFHDAAKKWMEDGFAMCDRDGVIEHSEEITTNTTYHEGPMISTNVDQTGSRHVTVRFKHGRYSALVQVKGSIINTKTIKAVVNGKPCETVITSTANYADADDPGAGLNGGITLRARVVMKVVGNKYTVTVHLPPEKIRQIDGGNIQDGCQVGLPANPPDFHETEGVPTTFVFRGTLPPSGNRTVLAGTDIRDYTTRVSPDEDPWFFDHNAAAAPLDRPAILHPVKVTTRWNFRYHP